MLKIMNSKSDAGAVTAIHWQKAWLGLGGNVGDVLRNMHSALAFLVAGGDVKIVRSSSVFETPPWGLVEQPVFLNCCVEVSTCLEPDALLELCLASEKSLKRERGVKWGPRTIDVDILLLENGVFDSRKLEVPHPRILERAFVLVPLAQIAGGQMLAGKSISEWREQVGDKGILQVAGSEYFDDLIASPTQDC